MSHAEPQLLREVGSTRTSRSRCFLMSTGLQLAAVALIFTVFTSKTVQQQVRNVATLVMPVDLAPARPSHPAKSGGGGGGGDRSPLPASKGRLPRPAPR